MATRYFVIAGRRFGSLDVIMPILAEIRRLEPTVRFRFVFMEPSAKDQVGRDPLLVAELERLAEAVHELRWGQGKLLGRLASLVRFVPVLACMLRSPGLVILHSRGMESGSMRCLALLARVMGGKCLEHPKAYVPFHLNPNPPHPATREGDGFLCFSDKDVPVLRAAGRTRIHAIGYPRMFESWQSRTGEMAQALRAREIGNHDSDWNRRIIALFMGSTVPGLFDRSELVAWLGDTLGVLGELAPEALILAKPHPMEKRQGLAEALAASGHAHARITNLHVSVLASLSDFVIAHHTSTALDGLAAGRAVIQYQIFTPQWMARHPEGSVFPKAGTILVQDRESLVRVVGQALAGKLAVPDVRELMGHREDLSVFLGKDRRAGGAA